MGSHNSKKTQETYKKGNNPEEDAKREEERQARLAAMYKREEERQARLAAMYEREYEYARFGDEEPKKKPKKGIWKTLFGKKLRF